MGVIRMSVNRKRNWEQQSLPTLGPPRPQTEAQLWTGAWPLLEMSLSFGSNGDEIAQRRELVLPRSLLRDALRDQHAPCLLSTLSHAAQQISKRSAAQRWIQKLGEHGEGFSEPTGNC